MDTLLNLYANASGLWKKVATLLPLLLGLGSLLSGLSGLCLELGHAANAAALLAIVQGLQHDPNTGLVVAGLAALGVHSNHQDLKAAVAGTPTAPVTTLAAPPAQKP